MKQTFFMLLILTIFLGLTACKEKKELGADAPPDAVPEIIGSYSVNGFDPLGTEYGGNLIITAGETSDTYHLQWIVTGSVQEGNGRLEGNTLYIEWTTVSSAAGQSTGTTIYTVTVDGELYGTRFVNGYPNEGTETAYPN